MYQAPLPYPLLIEALQIAPESVVSDLASGRTPLTVERFNSAIKTHTTQNAGMAEFREYNTEVQDARERYAEKNNWTTPGSRRTSLFEFVKGLSDSCLRWENDEPLFRIAEVDLWQAASFACGEDLFVAASLAEKNLRDNYQPPHFQWNYILRSDFYRLNSLIQQRKIVENHAHLWGTSQNVDICWLYLMNNPDGQEEKFRALFDKEMSFSQAALSYGRYKQCDLYLLTQVASMIRLWLFQSCVLGGDGGNLLTRLETIERAMDVEFLPELPSVIETISSYQMESPFWLDGWSVDYAITGRRLRRNGRNAVLSGERMLYYCCLRRILAATEPSASLDIQVLFYIYLLIKHRFDLVFIQQNKRTGFQNFAEYQDRKKVLVDSDVYRRLATQLAITDNIEENDMQQLEVRIGPEATAEEDSRAISNIDRYVRRPMQPTTLQEQIDQWDNPRPVGWNHFYVTHFIKKKGRRWSDDSQVVATMREEEARNWYRNEAVVLVAFRQSGDPNASRIFGIDAANNEVDFRPEIFGQVFRYVSGVTEGDSNRPPYRMGFLPKMRKTYHVGEDFYDPSDGLRAIDEAILFLELGQGDRIGHGVALGIDVEKWYQKHPTLALPVQNNLDNVAWMLAKVREWNIPISTAYYEKLRTAFESYFTLLYGESLTPDLCGYVQSWKFRSDDPECFRPVNFSREEMNGYDEWERFRIRDRRAFERLENEPNVYQMIRRYHFDTALKHRAEDMQYFSVEPELVELVSRLQERMRIFVASKGVAVESCPSSNYLISNLDRFSEIPTFRLFPVEEDGNGNLRHNVYVNTDDQGVLYTSLQKECAMLAGTLRKETAYSDDRIINWVEKLIENGKALCFKQS